MPVIVLGAGAPRTLSAGHACSGPSRCPYPRTGAQALALPLVRWRYDTTKGRDAYAYAMRRDATRGDMI